VFLMILGYVWVMVGAQGGGYVSRRIAYCSSFGPLLPLSPLVGLSGSFSAFCLFVLCCFFFCFYYEMKGIYV